MKKLLSFSIVLVMCLVMSSVVLATDTTPKKCTYPVGTIVMLFNSQNGSVAPLELAIETTITVLQETDKYYRFSAEYDKPGFKCPEHGIDTYEIYSETLPKELMSSFFVRKSDATSCK
jgi:hypothetical protein